MADYPYFLRLPDDTPRLSQLGGSFLTAPALLSRADVDVEGEGIDDYDDDERDDCLSRHLKSLSEYYPLWLDDDYRFVIVQDVRLSPGYNYQDIDFLVQLPSDYPFSPPGIGDNRIYTYHDLRHEGRLLKDLHVGSSPEFSVRNQGEWAWFCYEGIKWSCLTDDLVKFMEMVRADLTDPRVK